MRNDRSNLLASLLLVAVFALTIALHAGVDRWTSLGFDGGNLSGEETPLLVDPTDANIAYARTQGLDSGFYQTLDGGRRWDLVQHGLPPGSTVWLSLDPNQPEHLYLGQRLGVPGPFAIFGSSDRGRSWAPLETSGLGELGAPAIAVGDSSLWFALGSDEGGGWGVLRSLDGGAHWSLVFSPPSLGSSYGALKVAPHEARTLLFPTSRGVWRSGDDGEHWQLVDHRTNGGLLGQLYGTVFSPRDAQTVYAHDSLRLLRSRDAGSSWEELGPLPDGCPFGPMVLDVELMDRIYLGCDRGIRLSPDGGRTWSDLSLGLARDPFGPEPIFALATTPARPRVLYAGGVTNGVYRTLNRGALWQPASAGISDALVAALSFHPREPGRLFAVTFTFCQVSVAACGNAFTTSDGGRSWRPLTVPGRVVTVAVQPLPPSPIYATTSAGLFVSEDDGASWRLLTSRQLGKLAFHPTQATVLYAFRSGAERSEDGGRTWREIIAPQEGASHNSVLQVLTDPDRPDDLLAIGSSGFVGHSDDFFLESHDRGDTWVDLGAPDLFEPFYLVPGHPSRLYQGTTRGVRRSIDRGLTWETLPAPEDHLLVLPSAPATLLSYGESGIFRRTEVQTDWQRVGTWDSCSPPRFSRPVFAHPMLPDRLYATACQGSLAVAEFVGAPPLSLLDGRFEVRAALRRSGGPARPLRGTALSDKAATFSPAAAGDPLAALKILDGRAVNGRFWLFSAAVSGLEHTLTVLDTATGLARDYGQPAGPLTAVADLASFPPFPEAGEAGALAAPGAPGWTGGLDLAALPACGPGSPTLCLFGGRFKAVVLWERPGASGLAMARPLSDTAGAFWFFAEDNPELTVRMVDGRPVNGHFWWFEGGLSSLAYTVIVLDTVTGQTRITTHAAGTPSSQADFMAFSP